MWNSRALFSLLLLLSFAACQNDEEDCSEIPKCFQYLHLSHTKVDEATTIDKETSKIDFDRYDVLMLGGDLAEASSLETETMNNLDGLFDLSESSTLWSLGNHDYDDVALVEEFTGRLPYYTYHFNGVTFLVLDTQVKLSRIKYDQLELFNKVTDTIVESSHLILMTHKLLWMHGNEYLESDIDSIVNGGFGTCDFCTNPSNFYEDLYPQLVTVESRGVEVVCVAGDIGSFVKRFSFETAEGIDFLASGIESGDSDNQALVFDYNALDSLMSWEFVELDEL